MSLALIPLRTGKKMTIKIFKKVLDAQAVATLRALLDNPATPWEDGKTTAHGAARAAKNNQQLTKPSDALKQVTQKITSMVMSSHRVESYAMPVRMTAPFINKHGAGHSYGKHVDRGYRILKPSNTRIRTDLSATLALSKQDEYEGGNLIIYDNDSRIKVKLDAGDIVLYPSNFIHEVQEVSAGVRICACFWIQSMIRDTDRRTIISDMAELINKLATDGCAEASVLASKVQQNLIRQWAET